MAKVVYTKLEGASPREIKAKKSNVTLKRVAKDGQFVSVRTVSTASETFGRDFTKVFGANVRKAREENKRVAGEPGQWLCQRLNALSS